MLDGGAKDPPGRLWIDDVDVPDPYRNKCHNLFQGTWAKFDQRTVAWHQTSADYAIFHWFFKNLTRPGVYLEIGAYQPQKLSGSAFFDYCLGWHGICVEADPTKRKYWEGTDRSCRLYTKCLYHAPNVTLCLQNLNDGVTSIAKSSPKFDKKKPQNMCSGNQVAVPCTTLQAMLEEETALARNKPPLSLKSVDRVKIDFMSVDVEDHEIDVLRCFPFDKYDVTMLLLETRGHELTYDWFMMNKGYLKWDNLRNFGVHPTDSLYVKRSFLHPASDYIPWREQSDRFTSKEKHFLACPQAHDSTGG
mmetsp:Transcript_28213/g.68623  ORF Transcript_28213/g.68623 Transcript_28213/m.68623 type:complete len:304 (+) Transcript_28213:278-1189(+)